MEKEHKSSEQNFHEGFEYNAPKGKDEVDRTKEKPNKFKGIQQEANWHQERLEYTTVNHTDGTEWSKDSLLDAIEAGHVDVFTMNSFRFPPTFDGEWLTTFTALFFDDREFGERFANTVLVGFNRQPQLPIS
jgi:hypothetical protein